MIIHLNCHRCNSTDEWIIQMRENGVDLDFDKVRAARYKPSRESIEQFFTSKIDCKFFVNYIKSPFAKKIIEDSKNDCSIVDETVEFLTNEAIRG